MVRLFIAVPVPQNIKEQVTGLIADLKNVQGLPENIRFVPEENWHFTLVFLGYQDELVNPAIKKSIANILTSDVNNIEIQFEKLTYGPPGRTPRMLWLTVTKETSAAMDELKTALEKNLEEEGVRWRKENRPFQGHLTLARFEPISPIDLPKIDKKVDFGYSTEEINLMKSTLKRTGAEYEVL